MKNSAILVVILVCIFTTVFAQVSPLHKKISVDYQDMLLADVLQDIGKKADVRIAFAEKLVKSSYLVRYNGQNLETGRILNTILRRRGLKLASYEGKLLAVVMQEPGEEFRIKREQEYSFKEKPRITRRGDTVTIRFETESFCDCTIAVENEEGKIVRYLASGVLGPNAPEPFVWNSKKQVVVWDGKDDTGRYIDDKDRLTIRVSLGLDPRFERSHMWGLARRPSETPMLMAAGEEGIYVYRGGTAIDHIVLYDRDGNYIHTVYPFPADKINKTKGLTWQTYPQDGKRLPVKRNYMMTTMLTSGTNGGGIQQFETGPEIPTDYTLEHFNMHGRAASSIAVRGKRLVTAYLYLNKLGTDGTTGGLPLHGPKTSVSWKTRREESTAEPLSIALSPDEKTVYLTGYLAGHMQWATQDIRKLAGVISVPVVMKLDIEKSKNMEIFAGSGDPAKSGSDNSHFKVPACVDTDNKGRVYIADYMNDRIQVFDPQGKYLKTIKVNKPAYVAIHRKTGDIFVCSWLVRCQFDHTPPQAYGNTIRAIQQSCEER